jgi:hypothetical protein
MARSLGAEARRPWNWKKLSPAGNRLLQNWEIALFLKNKLRIISKLTDEPHRGQLLL